VWDGNAAVWGNRVVWGNSLIGETSGSNVDWGSLSNNVDATRVVWGNLEGLSIAPTSMTWGNIERANGDLVAK
jgi:hypothetical protein